MGTAIVMYGSVSRTKYAGPKWASPRRAARNALDVEKSRFPSGSTVRRRAALAWRMPAVSTAITSVMAGAMSRSRSSSK